MAATNKREMFIENLKLALANLSVYDSTIKLTDSDKSENFPTYSIELGEENYTPNDTTAGNRSYSNKGTQKFHVLFRYPVKKQQNLNLVLDSIIDKYVDVVQTNLEKQAIRKSSTFTDKRTLTYNVTINDYRITDIFPLKDNSDTPCAMILFDGEILFSKTV